MSLVPALDLRPASNDVAATHLPANVEAEQALLGCLLYDNSAFERIDDALRADHFFEPFHQNLFAAIETAIRKGQLAEPILLASQFERLKSYEELGGLRYLADLVDRAPPAPNAADYGSAVLEMAMRRSLAEICMEGTKVALDGDEVLRARDMIESTEAQLFRLGEHKAKQGFVTFAEALHGAVAMAAEAHSRDGGIAGLSTGLIDLDTKIGGLHPSDLVIIAARPSMGKSALACNIAFDVARHYAYEPQPDGSRKTVRGGIVGFFSLEMAAEQLAMRLLAEASGVSGDRLRKGEIDASEFGRVRDAALEIQDAPLYIDATGGIQIDKLCARARRMKRQHGLDLLIVDYLQLITGGDRMGRNDNRVQEVSMITQALKSLAKELAIPVIALAQLSRQVENREDKKPMLSDLRESGSIEQDADMVMFIYREAYYLSRTEPRAGTDEHFKWQESMDQVRNLADIIIGKQRHGPIGTVKLAFNEDLTKFSNLARDVGRYATQGARYTPGAAD